MKIILRKYNRVLLSLIDQYYLSTPEPADSSRRLERDRICISGERAPKLCTNGVKPKSGEYTLFFGALRTAGESGNVPRKNLCTYYTTTAIADSR